MAEKKDTRLKPGRSGNPQGRPKGSRHAYIRVMEVLMEGEAEDITRKAVDLAKEGDTTALRLCMDRIMPARRDGHITFDLPKLETAGDVVKASAALVQAAAAGQITPSEAGELSTLGGQKATVVDADHHCPT